MYQTSKIPELIDPQAMYTTNGQEAWRVLGIMAEFAAATERLRGMRPAVVDVRQRAHQARIIRITRRPSTSRACCPTRASR